MNRSNKAAEQDHAVVFGRPVERVTPLEKEKGVLILAPRTPAGRKGALTIQKEFESLGVKSSIHEDPDHDILLKGDRPIILLGNLGDSQCVQYMYYKFLTLVDKSYPGKEGYVVRTMPDPFATGFNLIHIGYSDEEGLLRGVKAFTEKIGLTLPFFNEVFCKHSPYDSKILERIKKTPLPEIKDLTPSIHTSYWFMKGFVHYITGDPAYLPTYFEGWRNMVELSKKDSAIIRSTHLYLTQHIEIWKLLESAGLIPDDLRGPIEECLFRWGESREGASYAKNNLGYDLPSHNHTMFCGVSLMYLADFFGKYYPSLEQPKEWADISDRVFESFDSGGWKPYCDDSSYSNQVTLPLVCSYSIFKDDHTFLNTSGKIASKWLKAIMGQNGIVPSFGDGTTKSPFPSAVSRLFAHYYQDGEWRWFHDRFQKEGEYVPGYNSWRLFDSGVEPVEPSLPSKMIPFPLDKRFYDIWEKNEVQGVRLAVTPPYGPYERCFDKLSVRTGYDEIEDDFLLIDGLGSNGIHAYSDAMGILDYTAKGIVWLVEENCYRFPEPEHMSILTVTKSGYAADIPGYALLEELKELSPDRFYIRMRLKNYNRCDWVREIHLIKGLCALFHDTVIPHEEGDYVMQNRFRTPAKACLEGNTMKSVRKNKKGEVFELRLKGFASKDYSVSLEEVPYYEKLFTYGGMHDETDMYNHFIQTVEDGKSIWERRYNEKEIAVTAMVTQVSGYLKEGEKLSFTHLVHPLKPKAEDLKIEAGPEGFVLYAEGSEYSCSLAHPVDNKGILLSESRVDSAVDKPEEVYAFERKITGIYPEDKNRLFATLEGGKLVCLSDSKPLWDADFEEEIHTVHIIPEEGMILVGYGPDKLSALDEKGRILWEDKTVRIPTLFDSWEYEYPSVEKITHYKEKGSVYILAGCGDNRIRRYNLKGELINSFYVYATVPDIIEFCDVDGDGKAEILAAGAKTSSTGVFRAFKEDGTLVRNILTGFWLSTICSHEIAEEEDRILMACGMNYAKNFKLFSLDKEGQKLLFEKNLGGSVKAVRFNEDRSLIAAGTSKGFFMVFDKTGKDIWQKSVCDSVESIYCNDHIWTVIGKNGLVTVMDSNFEIIERKMLPYGTDAFAKTEDLCYLASKNLLTKITLS